MKFSHRLIILSSIGFGIGVIVGVMITAFTATLTYADGNLYLCSKELIEAVGNPLLAFTIQALTSGIYGVIAVGGSVVYSIEEWSIVKCTSLHYLTVMIGYYIMAFLMRWFRITDIAEILTMFIMMTIAYTMIWMANYLSYKAQLKEINKELEELKSVELKGVSET